MRDLKKRVEELQSQLKKHRRSGLKELPTRTVFIDPLLISLGWNVRDPDEVELEHPTIDGKAVDYALKIKLTPFQHGAGTIEVCAALTSSFILSHPNAGLTS